MHNVPLAVHSTVRGIFHCKVHILLSDIHSTVRDTFNCQMFMFAVRYVPCCQMCMYCSASNVLMYLRCTSMYISDSDVHSCRSHSQMYLSLKVSLSLFFFLTFTSKILFSPLLTLAMKKTKAETQSTTFKH